MKLPGADRMTRRPRRSGLARDAPPHGYGGSRPAEVWDRSRAAGCRCRAPDGGAVVVRCRACSVPLAGHRWRERWSGPYRVYAARHAWQPCRSTARGSAVIIRSDRRVAPPGSGRAPPVGPSGSATVPVVVEPALRRRTPGGRRRAQAGDGARAANTSSGRTAGVTCRTTICSIAQPAPAPAASTRSVTAARASTSPEPVLGPPRDRSPRAGEERARPPRELGRRHARQLDPPDGGVDPVGERAGALAGLDALERRRRPSGRAASSAARTPPGRAARPARSRGTRPRWPPRSARRPAS